MKDQARLGAALRENLRRRKEQMKARDAVAKDVVPAPGSREARARGQAPAGIQAESAGGAKLGSRFRGNDELEKDED